MLLFYLLCFPRRHLPSGLLTKLTLHLLFPIQAVYPTRFVLLCFPTLTTRSLGHDFP